MKILYAAAEAAPFVKTGGLGDVAGSLPKALGKLGADARVILPLYPVIKERYGDKLEFIGSIDVALGWRSCYCGVFQYTLDGVIYYFVDNEQFFKRPGIYGEFDDGERFAFFSKAIVESCYVTGFYPDILHVNDWHTALAPIYLNAFYREIDAFRNVKTVLSIHNIEFQGKYDPYILGSVFGLGLEHRPILMYDGCLNLLKGGIESVDAVTTVSPTYAGEILGPEHSFGLENILRPRSYKLRGIINGIDREQFNPETDPALKTNYTHKTLSLKRHNKRELQRRMDLELRPDVPMIGMVSRLTPQKGMEMITQVQDELAGLDMQFVLLGTGDQSYEDTMRQFESRCHDRVRCIIAFSSELASLIYGASDFFLMPSVSEPCGLSQMIAMRYGSIPIVHRVGGLRDTVAPYNPETKEGNGITFESRHPYDMLDAVHRALALYHSKADISALRKNAMSANFGWDGPAQEYINLYNSL